MFIQFISVSNDKPLLTKDDSERSSVNSISINSKKKKLKKEKMSSDYFENVTTSR